MGNKSGIYCIKNTVSEKVYIGQAINLERRKYEHFNTLKKGIHFNSYLQRAWNKNPDELLWIFEVIEYCPLVKEILDDRETFWIAFYKATDRMYGYNLCSIGSSQLGTKHTSKSRKKISESHKGKACSSEHKRKLSEARKGKTHSRETKLKMSEAHKGKSSGWKGKTPTEESRKKMSEARKQYLKRWHILKSL